MRELLRTFSLAATVLLAASAAAQSSAGRARPVPLPAELPAELRKMIEAQTADADAQDAQPHKGGVVPGEALKRLQQIQFDRRPSTILQAWAKPEPEPFDEDADAPTSPGPAAPTLTPAPIPTPPAPPPGEFGPPAPAPAPVEDKAAAEAAAKAAAEAKEMARADRKLAHDTELLQRDVTLGRWDRVGAFLMTLPDDDRRPCYEHLLRNLANPQFLAQGNNRVPPNLKENNVFGFADVIGLADAAPRVPDKPDSGAADGGAPTPPGAPPTPKPAKAAKPKPAPKTPEPPCDLQKSQVPLLAPILQRALDSGLALEEWLAVLKREVAKPAAERALTPRRAALLLAAIGQDVELEPFLPTVDEAIADDDREALNLRSRLSLARYAKDKKGALLEDAWHATHAVLAKGEVSDEDKAEALRRAVELAPKIRDELGEAWLADSFTARPERGMEVLATIGTFAAQGMQNQTHDTAFRLKGLELQKTAVDALLQKAPERAQDWRETLNLLAANWITEARYANENSEADAMTPYFQRDMYGNIYYQSFGRRGGLPVQPLDPGDLVPVRPDGTWAELLDAERRPSFLAVNAQLYLKVNQEDEAFPFIEQLAALHAERAQDLAEEFLRVWTRNHNPNAANARTNQYMYMYGFEQRANAIPLTRSKQERNLQELAAFVARLRALPIGKLDENLLVEAFTQSHSTAEVYRLQALEHVFGPLSGLAPRTLASLAERMRANLASVWRRPDVQENAKTKRSQKDIEREVLEGYRTASEVLDQALATHGEHWALLTARAAMAHDENNFRQEVAKSSEFAGRRAAELERLARAAVLYASGIADLREDEYTTEPWDTWFYAALGASDLGAVHELNQVAHAEPPKIRASLESLTGEAGDWHRRMFANNLFTRMSSVRPQVKYRYLKTGFEIVGDHPHAQEARKVFDYYNDLVTEIRLVASIDGDAAVGSGVPFGVRVDLRHTREIERESGGFAKYLQNQNSQRYAYNYGRPTENYRDKFQEAATLALQEHFEVLSVTFNDASVRSKATDDYGWRVTPYAYLLLKAKGPQVDRLPPLRLDLDFLDTSGYAVLPVESPAVPLDASAAMAGPRPYDGLEITQILDERKASEGKLVLEIKATAKGLVPDRNALLELRPEGFEVTKETDQGVSITAFDDDHEHIRSERTWLVTFQARDGTAPPKRFAFARPLVDDAKSTLQRYADADLVAAQPVVDLEYRYGERGFPWLWLVLGLVAVGLAIAIALQVRARAARARIVGGYRVPEPPTPFAVLGLLRDMQQNNGFGPDAEQELAASITQIERHYFAPTPGDAIDLRGLAESWVRRAR